MKLVKDVGFVDEGDDGVVFSMAPLGAGGIKVFAPDGVESGNEDALALDGEIGAVVLEVVDARIFQVAEKMARRAVPSVVIFGAGDDAVGRGESTEFCAKFGE
ncbi:MAG: hypothetical protein QNL24_09610 [Akkermansiaceae bacterium]